MEGGEGETERRRDGGFNCVSFNSNPHHPLPSFLTMLLALLADFIMATYLADRVVVYTGEAGVEATATAPQPLLTGMNQFLKQLGVTFRRDPSNFRPRINKPGSVKDRDQKRSGNYFFMGESLRPFWLCVPFVRIHRQHVASFLLAPNTHTHPFFVSLPFVHLYTAHRRR